MGLGWGGGKGLFLWPATFIPTLRLGSLCPASWVAFSSVLDLSKCCWASSSPMTLSQHFCSLWSRASIYVHGQSHTSQHPVRWGDVDSLGVFWALWQQTVSGSACPCWTHHGHQINTGLTETTVTGNGWDPTEAQGSPSCTRSFRNAEEGADWG